MPIAHRNHYVPQWYQKLFIKDPKSGLFYLDMSPDMAVTSVNEKMRAWKRRTPRYCFWGEDLYTTTFGGVESDEVERFLFGDIDNNGASALRAVIDGSLEKIHPVFQMFFEYLDAQKLRTPKGLDWVKGQYSGLDQQNLMFEMQHLRQMHCTMWIEAVREIVSAEKSDVKFIVTDHPVTVYHPQCAPRSAECRYPSDPDISLKGSQTIFPLGPNHCLILTNLEYAEDPRRLDLLAPRINARHFGQTLTRVDTWVRTRKFTSDEVISVNHILKSRARRFVAAYEEAWLYPENAAPKDWRECGSVLLPPENELYHFRGETYVGHRDGTSSYQDAFGRTSKAHEFLQKPALEKDPRSEDQCPCGSGRIYGGCCQGVPPENRMPWDVYSIRERTLMHLNAIRGVFGDGKSWDDVRRELSNEQVADIHTAFTALWPRETNIADLLPRPDSRVFRGVYVGLVDPRTIQGSVVAWLSYFDEIFVMSPFMNAQNVKPEFSPIDSPGQYKQQTIMNVALLEQLAPFIFDGRVHLIPDPLDFNLFLRDSVWNIARQKRGIVDSAPEDLELGRILGRDSLKKFMARLSDESLRRQFQKSDPNLNDGDIQGLIDYLRSEQLADPLALLQPVDTSNNKGQLQQMRGVNFELAVFLAQLTGAAIYSDQTLTRKELEAARNSASTEPAGDTGAVERLLDLRLSLFSGYDPQAGEIERYSEVRTKLRDLWRVAAVFSRHSNAVAVIQTLDELQEVVSAIVRAQGPLKGSPSPANRVAAFDIDAKIIVPENGYGLNTVRRFLISFGRRNRLDAVPLAILFGQAIAAKSNA